MEQKFLERLQQTGIFDLRVIGRKVGVARPTSLMRGELTAQIIKIADGDLKPVSKGLAGKKPMEVELSAELNELVEYVTKSNLARTAYMLSTEKKSVEFRNEAAPFQEYYDGARSITLESKAEGYVYLMPSGEVALYSDEFRFVSKLQGKVLELIPDLHNGMLISLADNGNGKLEPVSIDGLPVFAHTPQPSWTELDKVTGTSATKIEESVPLPYGAVAGVGTRDEADFINAVMANGWFDSVRVLGWNGITPSERYPLVDSAVYCGLSASQEEEGIQFCIARAMCCAEMGERVLIVATGVNQMMFDKYASIWRQASGASVGGGSITVIFTGDFDADLPIWFECRSYTPIDLTKSYSKIAEREKTPCYVQMRAVTGGLSADKAFAAWHRYLMEKYSG